MITFTRVAYDTVIRKAIDSQQKEICGLLAGEYDDSDTAVESIYPAENVADHPETRYYIDPGEQFEIVEAIESQGLTVAGFYHSHPEGPTQPSATDAERATWPGLSYAIVALDGHPFLGSWRWRDGTFEQEIVRVI